MGFEIYTCAAAAPASVVVGPAHLLLHLPPSFQDARAEIVIHGSVGQDHEELGAAQRPPSFAQLVVDHRLQAIEQFFR